MAITSGYFNSVNGDRKYNADQMSEYFEGIINEGVCQHICGGLAVTAGTGLTVSVATGKAFIGQKWIKNDAALTLTITTAADQARIDAVVLRRNTTNRVCEIAVKTGTPSASPSAPAMTRTSTTYEMALAYVNVAAGATSVTVTDKRADTTVCGWATVAQATSGEVDAQLNALKTGFDGVVYPSPVEMVQGCDEVLQGEIDTINNFIDFETVVTSHNQIDQSPYIGKTAAQISDISIYFPNGKQLKDIGSQYNNVKVYLSIGGSTSLIGIVFYYIDSSGNNISPTLNINYAYPTNSYINAYGIKIHAYGSATSGEIDKLGVLFDGQSYDTYSTTKISKSKTILTNGWYGKKWISYGDSITQGNLWQPIVAKIFGLNHINKGVGGSTVASNPDSAVAPFCDATRIAALDSDADLITIMGGTNDWNGTNEGYGTPLGTLPTSSTYDTTEFYGALCQTVKLIQAQCPNAMIIIMSNINSRGTQGQASGYPPHNAIGLCSADYAEASRTVANYLGCAFIDMAMCGINIYNRAEYVADAVHPNAKGGELMARMVIAYLSNHTPNNI
jgi:lysophospholipase L1-like esterase